MHKFSAPTDSKVRINLVHMPSIKRLFTNKAKE